MKTISTIASFNQIKLLSDKRRMQILQMLMSQPATLTQLGRALGKHPAWVQHHIKTLEACNLVEISEVRVTSGIVEKFYRAKADGFILQKLILPNTAKPVLVFSGSHDLAIEQLAEKLSNHIEVLLQPVGSLDGLVNLRMGLCTLAGAHLLDSNGEYNIPTIRHLFPDRQVHLVTMANRIQGWMVAEGNPLGVHTAADLTRPSIRIVNRNLGSGTRLWLDRELQRLDIPVESITGYHHIVNTHTQVAETILAGKADVGLGLEAAAVQHGLDFIPLFAERYDLVYMHDAMPSLEPVLNFLQTVQFRRVLKTLSGYDSSQTGNEVHFD